VLRIRITLKWIRILLLMRIRILGALLGIRILGAARDPDFRRCSGSGSLALLRIRILAAAQDSGPRRCSVEEILI
jgi:hypothetical protein